MKQQLVISGLLDLVRDFPGVMGCALVEADTGLVWHSVGDLPDKERLWEASANYWQLHGRSHEHFAVLGGLGAAVLYHRRGSLAIIPCLPDPALLAVCVGEPGRVNWQAWQQGVRALAGVLERAVNT
jgi:predicted regulator of Ras-like GTPase activity (Roadblock/LC7/MglB family)